VCVCVIALSRPASSVLQKALHQQDGGYLDILHKAFTSENKVNTDEHQWDREQLQWSTAYELVDTRMAFLPSTSNQLSSTVSTPKPSTRLLDPVPTRLLKDVLP